MPTNKLTICERCVEVIEAITRINLHKQRRLKLTEEELERDHAILEKHLAAHMTYPHASGPTRYTRH